MAWFRCSSGGGAMSETVLWTNSSWPPSASSGLTMTLSESITNYTYIAIKYVKSTSSYSDYYTAIMSVDDFKNTDAFIVLGVYDSLNAIRMVTYDTDTSMIASGGGQFRSSNLKNSYCIPYQVIGLK